MFRAIAWVLVVLVVLGVAAVVIPQVARAAFGWGKDKNKGEDQ